MARQTGPHFITGTIDNITFYKWKVNYYMRLKSSIDGKRIQTDPAFEEFRGYSKDHGLAATIAKPLYYTLTKEERIHGEFGRLTAEIRNLLREGFTPGQIIEGWNQWLISEGRSTEPNYDPLPKKKRRKKKKK